MRELSGRRQYTDGPAASSATEAAPPATEAVPPSTEVVPSWPGAPPPSTGAVLPEAVAPSKFVTDCPSIEIPLPVAPCGTSCWAWRAGSDGVSTVISDISPDTNKLASTTEILLPKSSNGDVQLSVKPVDPFGIALIHV